VKYKKAVQEGNLVLARGAKRLADEAPRVIVRVNKYDANRANVAIYSWAGKDAGVDSKHLKNVLQRGDPYRLMDPRDFYGKPVLSGTYDGKAIKVPVKDRKFAALVLLKGV